MEFTTFLFYLFAAVMLFSALRVITARNPVHAVLFLVLAFFNAAGLWLLLQAEFLAIALIMVYVGAVMVLFLFVVMMLDINIERLRHGFWSHLPLGATIGVIMVVEMTTVLTGRYFSLGNFPAHVVPAGESNTKALARILFTDYVYPFELASVILLVAIIAAVMLTLRQRKDTKGLRPSDQVAVKRSDRLRIVAMASESETPVTESKGGAPL
ncbi:NADH:ubiquinone oxidoreductase subunit J [Rugosibacter aromaticivorans]|uniref:NADH-quinone oxidoreductase subunit J n=1 Tax=Rugosibacter aromaticivorans TaxID=1565605 RepID=A0A0C5J9K9_9PROT|nr:NADH-quinone oxidoreductase subunit J [Rugosibacter aromaticivorans]AJP48453.1 NADH:ubiquinone oxidoreductase subunit J [Rugosibacter aromaticivorans]TBR15317.1 MAG: NADH-quinone oxidoreductase subunit J [Rugosibacter sp.]